MEEPTGYPCLAEPDECVKLIRTATVTLKTLVSEMNKEAHRNTEISSDRWNIILTAT